MFYNMTCKDQIEFSVFERKVISIELAKFYVRRCRVTMNAWVGKIDANMLFSNAELRHLCDYRAGAATYFENTLNIAAFE